MNNQELLNLFHQACKKIDDINNSTSDNKDIDKQQVLGQFAIKLINNKYSPELSELVTDMIGYLEELN